MRGQSTKASSLPKPTASSEVLQTSLGFRNLLGRGTERAESCQTRVVTAKGHRLNSASVRRAWSGGLESLTWELAPGLSQGTGTASAPPWNDGPHDRHGASLARDTAWARGPPSRGSSRWAGRLSRWQLSPQPSSVQGSRLAHAHSALLLQMALSRVWGEAFQSFSLLPFAKRVYKAPLPTLPLPLNTVHIFPGA